MVEIDDWIPNFEMFVLIVLPALILVTVAVFIISWWVNRPKKDQQTPMDWMDIFKFGTALYMIVPIYRIIGYIQGDVGQEELVRGLFVTDFYNYMLLALVTGIMGLMLILKEKMEGWMVKA